MNYLFWCKIDIEDPDLDKDPYPWIIWYIWKARNDKLFRRLDRDPLETVRHAKSECHAWFEANDRPVVIRSQDQPQEPLTDAERCMVDGSWIHDALFSGCGWTWKNSQEGIQLIGVENQHRGLSPLHLELEALLWAMDCMQQMSTCQTFGTDCKDLVAMTKDPEAWPNFSTELKEFSRLKHGFTEFSISYIPRAENVMSDSLAKIARTSIEICITLVVLFRSGSLYHFKLE